MNLNLDSCKKLMAEFIERFPEVWNEDIGEEEHKHTEECVLLFFFVFRGRTDFPFRHSG